MNLSAWWGGLSTSSMVFWCVALPATVVLLLHLALTFLGLGGDVDTPDIDLDGDIDTDFDSADFPILTLRNFEAFFAMFGWGGLLTLEQGANVLIATVVGTTLGAGFAVLMTLIMKTLVKMQRSGTADPTSAIGKTATVYIAIPENGKGFGKINIELDGIVRERKAISTGGRIERGETIIVKSYSNNQYLVERG